jgi:hypothetical protein
MGSEWILGRLAWGDWIGLAQDRDRWRAVVSAVRFTPGERTPGTHCTGGWVGPRAGLDTEARGKILSPLPEIEPRSPGRPARSQTLHWLSYPAHLSQYHRRYVVWLLKERRKINYQPRHSSQINIIAVYLWFCLFTLTFHGRVLLSPLILYNVWVWVWVYLHSINPKQVSTFGYRTNQRVTYITYNFSLKIKYSLILHHSLFTLKYSSIE